MLTVYAAWAEGAVEADIVAIREAINRTVRRRVPWVTTLDEPNSTIVTSGPSASSAQRSIEVTAPKLGMPPAGWQWIRQ
jgi:hypothetical protein